MDEAADPGQAFQRASVHPEHDAVAQEISGWFTASAPEINYEVSEHWYGYLGHLSVVQSRVILRVDDPGQLPDALADAVKDSGHRALTIWVDDRERAAMLDATLRLSGCQRREATTHLALVGSMAEHPGPRRLVIESVDDAGLADWARVKLQSFGDIESAPAADMLAQEVANRRTEQALAELQVGLLGSEAVAVLAYYEGPDQLVFILGTRLPYRHQGIAQAMLARWAAAGTARGCRSLMINATEGGRPAELYRRLGFVDEVYWYQTYELDL